MQLTQIDTDHDGSLHAAWDVHETNDGKGVPEKIGEIAQLHTTTAHYNDQGPFRADSSMTRMTKSRFSTLEDATEWLTREARRERKRQSNNEKMANR